MEIKKLCNKCGVDKPLTDFHKDLKNKDGVFHTCKKCRKDFTFHSPDLNKKEKWCSKCKEVKPIVEFTKNKSNTDGYFGWCKLCSKFHSKEYKKQNKICHSLKTYGLTQKQVEQMFVSQKGKCAICDTLFKDKEVFHIDHNHSTKKIRQLLCPNCNKGLGFFKENKDALLKAIDYLNKWE